jgi:hypothetical protein
LPRVLLAGGLALACLSAPDLGRAQAPKAGKAPPGREKEEDKGNYKRFFFESGDGVRLRGYFFPAGGKKKDACVLLLHGLKKGESFKKDEWLDLAEELQKDGYAVLGFDFRGYGDSKELTSPEGFWGKSYNQGVRRTGAGGRLPEHIEASQFAPGYYLYLLNDILAAKAYLDRRNDAGEVNTSNLFVIGTDEAATLGLAWMASEWHLVRDKNPPGVGGPPNPDEPEGRGLVGAVWLGLTPTLGGQTPNPSPGVWVRELGKEHKVPMLFVYGAEDAKGEQNALAMVRRAFPGYKPPKPDQKATDKTYELFRDWAIPKTKLTGSTLLQVKKTTADIKLYLAAALENRGPADSKVRDAAKSQYLWTLPPVAGVGLRQPRFYPYAAKPAGDAVPSMPPPQVLGAGR